VQHPVLDRHVSPDDLGVVDRHSSRLFDGDRDVLAADRRQRLVLQRTAEDGLVIAARRVGQEYVVENDVFEQRGVRKKVLDGFEGQV
jgi:hypothetical protein